MTRSHHIVIAGSNKCGTTSVYRYLSDHPAVCGSAQKETDFFHYSANYDCSDTYEAYLKLFPDLSNDHQFCVEATPTYLDAGQVVAERINRLLEEPYILLLLRDPTDRMVSYYRSKQGLETSLISQLSFNAFVDKALGVASSKDKSLSESDKRIGNQINKAHYVQFLEEYLRTIPADQLRIMFFEDVRDEPLKTMQTFSNSIGLSSNFYRNYTFHVENRSRFHRVARLRTLATKINAASEPVLNRVPFFRRRLRSLYNAVNTIPGKGQSFDAEKLQDLKKHFRPHNDSLRTLLEREFDIESFPDWLTVK